MRFFKGIPFLWIGNPLPIVEKHDKVVIGSVFQPFSRVGITISIFILWWVFDVRHILKDSVYEELVGKMFDRRWVTGHYEEFYYSKQDTSLIGDKSSLYQLLFKRGVTSFYRSSTHVATAGLGYSPFLDMWFGWKSDFSQIKGFKIGDSMVDNSGVFVAHNMKEVKHLARYFSQSK